jgi:hypothetical protein
MWANVLTKEWDPDFIGYLLEWLGYDGVAFFQMCMDAYNTVSPIWQEGKPDKPYTMRAPHPVHFREGVQVRNAMRRIHKKMGLGVYGGRHFYDDNWQSAVQAALKMCEEGYTDEHRAVTAGKAEAGPAED